jgi:AcrR family transcriptional regulator
MDNPQIDQSLGGKGEEQETRERIMAAARQLMAQKGYKGATTRKISELAGVNEVTIFRHFKSKDALFEELLSGLVDIRLKLEQSLQGDFPRFKEMLMEYAKTYYSFLVDRKEILMICMIEADNHPSVIRMLSNVPMTAVEVLCEKIKVFQDQGHLRPTDPCTPALMFVSTFFHLFMAKHRINLDIDIVVEELFESAADVLMRGIVPHE